jgi:hypothetical protein
MTLLYGIIVCFIFWCIYKNTNYFKWSLALVLLFISWIFFDDIQIVKQNKIVVYAIPHGSAIDFIAGKNYTSFKDSLVQSNHITQNFHLKPARILFGIKNEKVVPQNDLRIAELSFKNNKIVYLSKVENENRQINIPPNAIIVVAHNAIKNIHKMTEKSHPKMIVFDSSNSLYKTKKWTLELADTKIPIWNTALQGAVVLDL